MSQEQELPLKNKTAIITGSTRGIGKEISLTFAKLGANVVITGKSKVPNPKLAGTIYTTAEEIRQITPNVLAVPLDVRDENAVAQMVQDTVTQFGSIDILINNASAIHLAPTSTTPLKRYDLMMDVNVRGTFVCSQACIPYLKKATNPHILTLSPPINMHSHWFKDFLAYTLSKYSMTLCAIGLADELRANGIASNSLWPQTTIATAAVKNLFPAPIYEASRVPLIVAKAASYIVQENSRTFTGQCLIDEKYLRSKGETDFEQYAVNPSVKLQRDLFLDE